jgi:hypothetical protein
MVILVEGKIVFVHVMKAYRENLRTAPLVLNLRPMWRYVVILEILAFKSYGVCE